MRIECDGGGIECGARAEKGDLFRVESGFGERKGV